MQRRCDVCAQARRLVKNSIIAVEAPDEDMADNDWVDDQEEADEVLARHRRPAGAAGEGSGLLLRLSLQAAAGLL